MRNIYLVFMLITFVTFSSCTSKKTLCYIEYLEQVITFPEQYEIINCKPDIYDKLIHLQIKKEDVENFVLKNGFLEYRKPDNDEFSDHYYFVKELKEYFDFNEQIEPSETFFFKTSDKKKNYLSSLITSDGHFFAIIEEKVFPPTWEK